MKTDLKKCSSMKHISKSYSQCSLKINDLVLDFSEIQRVCTAIIIFSLSIMHRHSSLPTEVPQADALLHKLSDDRWVAVSSCYVHRRHPKLKQKHLKHFFLLFFPEKCPNKLWPYFHPRATLHSWSAAWPHQCDHPQWQRGVGSSLWYGSCKQMCTDSSGNICQPLSFEHCFNISIEVWQL